MAVIMATLGFQPKGRDTIRRMTPSNRTPRRIEPWVLQPKEGTTLGRVERAYLDALEAVDAIEEHKAKAAASGKFTPEGLASDVLQYAASTLAPKLHRARQIVEAAKADAMARRAKLVLRPAEKTDAAGQMRRLWKLDKFNAMPDAERNSFIAKNIDNLDPELTQAFLEMPEYSKVLGSDLETIRDRALQAEYGEEVLAEQRELETGIAICADVLPVAREEVARDASGLAAFNAAAAPYERAASAPWLRKFIEDGTETIKRFTPHASGRYATWQPATPDEIEAGVYFSSAQEWRRAQGETTPTRENTNGGA